MNRPFLSPGWSIVAVLLVLGGCTSLPEAPPVAEPPVAVEPVPVPVPAMEPAAPTLPQVAIVVSRDVPRYTRVADELAGRVANPHRRYSLEATEPKALSRRIRANGETIVVALGPAAVRMAGKIPGAEVIYAEVLEAPHFPSGTASGVAAIPPFSLQLSHWRSVSPGLGTIGVIASARMRDEVRALQHAAAGTALTLLANEVSSDKEALWRFRLMLPDIDGFVLLPDESVLSPNVIQRILDLARRNEKQVVVYSEPLFELGAFMLITPVPADVADRLIALIAERTATVLPLTAMAAEIDRGDTSMAR